MASMDSIQPGVTGRKARRVNDACRAIGIGRSTLYKLANEGKIKLVHVLGRTLVPETEIERLASEGVE
jgi:excisionase family DNA binding protein